jgi:hypothetical protein
VDFVEILGTDISLQGDPEVLTTRVPMCVYHWDEYQKSKNDKP